MKTETTVTASPKVLEWRRQLRLRPNVLGPSLALVLDDEGEFTALCVPCDFCKAGVREPCTSRSAPGSPQGIHEWRRHRLAAVRRYELGELVEVGTHHVRLCACFCHREVVTQQWRVGRRKRRENEIQLCLAGEPLSPWCSTCRIGFHEHPGFFGPPRRLRTDDAWLSDPAWAKRTLKGPHDPAVLDSTQLLPGA